MAQMLKDRIIETGLIHKAVTGKTFITSFKTNTSSLSQGKSSELSWTSINTQSVFLDGQEVEKEGSRIVSPLEKTTYQLVAKGEKSNDTVQLVQHVYFPELTQLRISPASKTATVGDTIFFKLILMRDQFNQPIENQTYDVTWNITENGKLFEETDNSVYFICDSPGTFSLKVSYKDKLLHEAKIIVNTTTNLEKKEIKEGFSIYPNPSENLLYINADSSTGPFEIQLFDMTGRLKLKKGFPHNSGHDKFQLNLSNLVSGTYIVQISNPEGVYSEKLIIEGR
jgi:hypothetical protein